MGNRTPPLCDEPEWNSILHRCCCVFQNGDDPPLSQCEYHRALAAENALLREERDRAVDDRVRWAARLAEADKANQLLRAEIAAQSREEDLILTALRLDPERYRTECGYLNVPKIIAAIKHPDQYPRLADSADDVQCQQCNGTDKE